MQVFTLRRSKGIALLAANTESLTKKRKRPRQIQAEGVQTNQGGQAAGAEGGGEGPVDVEAAAQMEIDEPNEGTHLRSKDVMWSKPLHNIMLSLWATG